MRRGHDLMCLSVVIAAAVLAVPSFAAEEQTAVIPFESEDWTITSGSIVDHLGRKALAGLALLKDVEFTDGIIEVDIAITQRFHLAHDAFASESLAATRRWDGHEVSKKFNAFRCGFFSQSKSVRRLFRRDYVVLVHD